MLRLHNDHIELCAKAFFQSGTFIELVAKLLGLLYLCTLGFRGGSMS